MLSLNLPDRRLGKFDSTCRWGGGGWAAAMGEWQLCGRSGGWGAWLWHRVWRGGGPADLDAEAVCERVLWARCLVLGCPLILRMSGGLVMSGTVCVCVQQCSRRQRGAERTEVGKRWDARSEYSWPMPCGPMPKAFASG